MITRICANCPGSAAVAAVTSRLPTPGDKFYEIASDITACKYAASASLCQRHLLAVQ